VTNATASAVTTDAAALKRGYGAVDMRFQACVKRSENTLTGQECPAGTVIYGPYVGVPPEAEVEVTFDIKPSATIEVFGDLVAEMGQRFIAALNPQTIPAGEERRLGYRVRVDAGATAIESRIGFRGAGPFNFQVRNYTVTVR